MGTNYKKKKVVEIFFYKCSANLKITINYFAFENKTISNHHEKKVVPAPEKLAF